MDLRQGNWQELVESQESLRVGEKLNRILRLIGRKAEGPGGTAVITHAQDYYLYSSASLQELVAYLDYLQSRGLVKLLLISEKTHCTITVPGWQAIEPMLTPGGIEGGIL